MQADGNFKLSFHDHTEQYSEMACYVLSGRARPHKTQSASLNLASRQLRCRPLTRHTIAFSGLFGSGVDCTFPVSFWHCLPLQAPAPLALEQIDLTLHKQKQGVSTLLALHDTRSLL
jgi:hypothetical protein